MECVLDRITEISVGSCVRVTDERGNSYVGEFDWDSTAEVHRVDEYKIVAEYDAGEVFLVKPIDSDVLSGFLVRVRDIEVISDTV